MSKKKRPEKVDPIKCEMTGSVCVSLSGHDAGNLLVIIGRAENGYVYVADGRSHGICTPKLKNTKHVSVISRLDKEICEKIASGNADDALVRASLSAAAKEKLC